jgi:glycine hydroxymethyltransferase
MHVIAAKAVALKEAMTEEFRAYQRQVVANAKALAAALKNRGLRLLTDGTDNHMLVVDLRGEEMTGKAAQETLDQAHITVNRNAVPADPRSPFVTSGVRIGTPAVTTRGMKEAEMDLVGDLIVRALGKAGNPQALAAIADEVVDLCKGFPIYSHRLGS